MLIVCFLILQDTGTMCEIYSKLTIGTPERRHWRSGAFNVKFQQISHTALIFRLLTLRIHWRLPTILETSNKSVWSNVFWYVKVCIFWKCIQYTIHWDKTNLKKIPYGQNKRYKKMASFFFHELKLISFTFKVRLSPSKLNYFCLIQ